MKVARVTNLTSCLKELEEAAAAGYAIAQCTLGLCYQDGDGVEKDLVKAREWLTKAAARGNERAKKALAQMDNEPQPEPKPQPQAEPQPQEKKKGFFQRLFGK